MRKLTLRLGDVFSLFWMAVILFAVGCAKEAVPPSVPLPTLVQPIVTSTAFIEPTMPVVIEAEDTPMTAGDSGVPSPIPLTTAPTAEATAVKPTSLPPAVAGVEQPPYAASDCSDKYPCNDDVAGWESRIRVPAGFSASYFSRIEGAPTSMTFGPGDLLYVAAQDGTIYTIDSDGIPAFFMNGFQTPTGIAFRPGTDILYVSDRVVEDNAAGESRLSTTRGGAITPIITGLPCCYASMHAANGIAFGPDGWGYVGVGARADHGEILGTDEQDELHPYEASILRFNEDGSIVEVYARGIRNPYDITWDADGQLWATDNAPDFGPPEELQRIIPGREHGYPWYDCDTCFTPPPDLDIVPPTWTFVPHSSPTGIIAYLAEQFPGYYNSLFLTLWSAFPDAQKVVWVAPGGSGAANFATGFASPIDVTVGPEGSLYVADWATGIIFKISYTG